MQLNRIKFNATEAEKGKTKKMEKITNAEQKITVSFFKDESGARFSGCEDHAVIASKTIVWFDAAGKPLSDVSPNPKIITAKNLEEAEKKAFFEWGPYTHDKIICSCTRCKNNQTK